MSKFALIVAATEDLGIGFQGTLPWRIPKDMAFFKHVTTHVPRDFNGPSGRNAVIMGRVTWESIPPRFRPLPDRFNIIVSRNPSYDIGDPSTPTILVNSMEDAFKAIDPSRTPRVFVIGGAQMYKIAIQHPLCSHILLTRIKSDVLCDTFFPEIDENLYRLATHEELEAFVEGSVPRGIQSYKDLQYEFTMYVRR